MGPFSICAVLLAARFKISLFRSCVVKLVELRLVIELSEMPLRRDELHEVSKKRCVAHCLCANETSCRFGRLSRDMCGPRRRRVCVTHLRVGGDQSPVDYCRCRRAAAFDGSASPTLGTPRSYTDGVINGRRAREGNLSLISTFAPDCHLC